MKIKPEHLPQEINHIAEELRSRNTSSQLIFDRRTKGMLLAGYTNGPTENSTTVSADNALGKRHETCLYFTRENTLKYAKIPRELSLGALRRTIIKNKRDAYRASQAEIVACLLLRAEKHIS